MPLPGAQLEGGGSASQCPLAHRRGEILQLRISSSQPRARGVQRSRGLVKA